MILVLSNQVDIVESLASGRDGIRFWTFGHQFFRSTVNIWLKYILSRAGETCYCSNNLLKNFSVTDFGTFTKSWKMRETPFGETGFRAVGSRLVAQVSQTIVPGVGFWCFCSKRARFLRFFVSRVFGVFTPKTGFLSKNRPLCLPVGRGRSLPVGRDFGPGDTTLGRPSDRTNCKGECLANHGVFLT